MAAADSNPDPDFDSGEYSSRRPVRRFEWEDLSGGCVAVLRPKFGRGWFGRFMQKRMRRPFIRIKLDEFGSFVWLLCDGERSVSQIAAALSEKFGEIDDLSRRLPLFFAETERAGLIHWQAAEASDWCGPGAPS